MERIVVWIGKQLYILSPLSLQMHCLVTNITYQVYRDEHNYKYYVKLC